MTSANRDKGESTGKSQETTLDLFPYKTNNVYHYTSHSPSNIFNKKRETQAQLHIANI